MLCSLYEEILSDDGLGQNVIDCERTLTEMCLLISHGDHPVANPNKLRDYMLESTHKR